MMGVGDQAVVPTDEITEPASSGGIVLVTGFASVQGGNFYISNMCAQLFRCYFSRGPRAAVPYWGSNDVTFHARGLMHNSYAQSRAKVTTLLSSLAPRTPCDFSGPASQMPLPHQEQNAFSRRSTVTYAFMLETSAFTYSRSTDKLLVY